MTDFIVSKMNAEKIIPNILYLKSNFLPNSSSENDSKMDDNFVQEAILLCFFFFSMRAHLVLNEPIYQLKGKEILALPCNYEEMQVCVFAKREDYLLLGGYGIGDWGVNASY